jgi:transaldolase/glucose-6-phosphate isomerase
MNGFSHSLTGPLAEAARSGLAEWTQRDGTRRLWARDASLWTGSGESAWLGWLDAVAEHLQRLDRARELAEQVRAERFTHALLLGMGGSSLCAEVLAATFGRQEEHPELLVLDSTVPAQVRALGERVDVERTLFLVSSKSGTTLEPNVFLAHFLAQARRALGAEAGRRFVAITDPGSKLQEAAEREGFRHVFHGVKSIGGRYSALSFFGLVPAAVMGLDVERLLRRTQPMVDACGPDAADAENPGVALGVILGTAAARGRDKLTFVSSPGLRDLGAWLEQLLAESTGKNGKGIIPVDGERLASPELFGDDRLFAYVRLASAPDPRQDQALAQLEAAGHPIVRCTVEDHYALGQEFFRWELATAVAGAVMGVNPFDQPDVEASKLATRALTADFARTGALPPEAPLLEESGVRVYADPANAQALLADGPGRTLAGHLRAHLARLRPADYFALLAYLPMSQSVEERLQATRHRVRDRTRAASCLGFGPRFLHSTGQAYKGGPNTGVFVQVTCDDALDLPVPGEPYTFGVIQAAQARGDFAVLAERGRRALRVHLGPDLEAGLDALDAAVAQALAE